MILRHHCVLLAIFASLVIAVHSDVLGKSDFTCYIIGRYLTTIFKRFTLWNNRQNFDLKLLSVFDKVWPSHLGRFYLYYRVDILHLSTLNNCRYFGRVPIYIEVFNDFWFYIGFEVYRHLLDFVDFVDFVNLVDLVDLFDYVDLVDLVDFIVFVDFRVIFIDFFVDYPKKSNFRHLCTFVDFPIIFGRYCVDYFSARKKMQQGVKYLAASAFSNSR